MTGLVELKRRRMVETEAANPPTKKRRADLDDYRPEPIGFSRKNKNTWGDRAQVVTMYLRSCKVSLRPNQLTRTCSGNKCRGCGRVVFECRWDLLFRLVVAGKAMDTGFDQNQSELGVLVFPVGLEVLANSNSLLHKVPEVLGDAGGKSYIGVSGRRLVMSRERH